MDRNMLLRHLAMAKRHVTLGENHLARQEALLAELDRDGHDTTDTLAIQETMRHTQTLQMQDRDRLLAQLAL
ncbi:hypothetical protein [Bradyrhizobium sp. CCBAU 53415]|uniref:hypothetical protein n=1 Tax=Bradyrhizobium sp. CCBAU 53415 TaxID=1325119 RepID=UPI0023056F0C|nr:hypothetical protein [Bradyrhizobium sp. CCBAU 53415]MDA9464989.1 hypothetical protein [Bradyrhizobium sp. CCBAU 53415]